MRLYIDRIGRSLELEVRRQVVCLYVREPFQFARGVARAASGFYSRYGVGESVDKYAQELARLTANLHHGRWRTLYYLVRELRPDTCVETGTGRGITSAYILRALEVNKRGHLYSMEVDPRVAGKSIPPPLRGRLSLAVGDSKQVLPKLLTGLGGIDIFFHDGDHSFRNMTFEFEMAWQHVRPGGALVSDDVTSNEAFLRFCERRSLRPRVDGFLGYVLKPGQ